MDVSVGQDHHHVVHLHLQLALHEVQQGLEEHVELRGARQANLSDSLSVRGKDVVQALDYGVCLAVQVEAVAYLVRVHVPGNSSKSKNTECLLESIRLNDSSHFYEGLLILVQVPIGVLVVQALHLAHFSIARSEVDRAAQVDCPARPQVLHERGHLDHQEGINIHDNVCSLLRWEFHSLLVHEFGDSRNNSTVQLVIPILLEGVELNSNGQVEVSIAQPLALDLLWVEDGTGVVCERL